ncbi:MAG: AI-2E family transporter, partial [Verrucomicrobiota bacterium]|nr:AI-2E family transporter [Verrucomicrobiota bacterium]
MNTATTGPRKPVVISYAFFAGLMLLVTMLHLGTPFVAALFCYLALQKLAFGNRRWLALLLFVVLFAGLFAGCVFFLKRAANALPDIVETTIPTVVQSAQTHGIELPFTDLESLKSVAMDSVRGVLGDLGNYVRVATKEFVFLIFGIVIAAGIFLNPDFETGDERRAGGANLYSVYTAEIRKRFASLYRSFETVIGAQIIISALNTCLTGIFLFSFGLRHATVVLILTFLCGLLPIVGNLISNTIIVCIAFTVSIKLAIIALAFLAVIHKLEYFLNSRIIGSRIHHPMWLILLALLIGEQLMGIPGMILAP